MPVPMSTPSSRFERARRLSPEERSAIDDEIRMMGRDAEYQEQARRIDAEFASVDREELDRRNDALG